MFERMRLRITTIEPAYLLAPMAGVTHAPFRRLVADFGGYGLLYTEMLSGAALLHEDLKRSPFTRQRAKEGRVLYQLGLTGREDIGAVVRRISEAAPFGLDLNLGCPAPEIRRQGSGVSLFGDLSRLESVLGRLREHWQGVLTVKCRLGDNPDNWERPFVQRLRLFERAYVDAVIVHPRFGKEKLKRRARWELFKWIKQQTDLLIVANGDITGPGSIEQHADLLAPASGIMIGRLAAVKPWIFLDLAGTPVQVNYAEVWERFFRYVCEDFPAPKAIGRIKEFTAYYARNFLFAHELYRAVQGARSLGQAHDAALSFLTSNPATVKEPSVAGI